MPLRAPNELRKKVRSAKTNKSGARSQESKREPLIEAAAQLFATKGYRGTSMRDIASAVDILVGSIYYHFVSKEEILLNVYERGVSRFTESIQDGLVEASNGDPWERLKAASVGHLNALLEGGPFTRLGSAEFIQSVPKKIARGLIEQRDRYESEFERIIVEIPLKRESDRFYIKMFLLGGLTSTLSWYRPGKTSPAEIAQNFVNFLRYGVDA